MLLQMTRFHLFMAEQCVCMCVCMYDVYMYQFFLLNYHKFAMLY